MGDLSKIVFFSQKLLINLVTYKVTNCIILGIAGTLFMKTHFLLDLTGQIKVTISENSIIQYRDMLRLIYQTIVI